MVRRDVVAAPLLAVLAGCTMVISTPPVAHPTESTTSTTVVVTTTTVVPATTTTIHQGPPLGLITPTGVPVAIRLVLPSGYLVHTPCGNVARVSGGEPLYRTPVVLDPGHGGNRDIGAQGRNGLPEKVLNLEVALATQEVLAEMGIAAVLTRVDDYATTLSGRTRLADLLQAEVLVSIHHNAPTPAPSPVPGVEVFIQSHSAESHRLGGLLYHYTFAALNQFDVAWTAAPDSGVITVVNSRGIDAYGIIRLPETPSALIELGYISNPAEAELFATAEYVEAAAHSLATAIRAYLETDEPGTGWYQPGRVFNPSPAVGRADCVETELE